MPYRAFGKGKKASVLTFAYSSDALHQLDQPLLTQAVQKCLANGINVFGVEGKNERKQAEQKLGVALKESGIDRKKLIVFTKIYLENQLNDPSSSTIESEVERINTQLEESLESLQVKSFDLVIVEGHNTRAEEVLRALSSQNLPFATTNWSTSKVLMSQSVQGKATKFFQLSYSLVDRQNLEENYRSLVQRGSNVVFASNQLASGILKDNSQLNVETMPWNLKKFVSGKTQEDTFWKIKDL